MDRSQNTDIDRDRDLRRLIDQIPVPNDSFSDISSRSCRSPFESEVRPFSYQLMSPESRAEDFFSNSINSTIANNNSPGQHFKQLGFDQSQIESEISQISQAGAFTPQQVSRMMDWSKTHITPAEGLFPQVSAPSMSLDPDENYWNNSPPESPSRDKSPHGASEILPPHRRVQTSFEKPIPNPVKRPVSQHGPGKEPEVNWFFVPGNYGSKRQSQNSSFRKQNASSDFPLQGSALLSSNAYHSSENSLLQFRENAATNEEMQKIANELSLARVALRKEQELHEQARRELVEYANYTQTLEHEKRRIEDRLLDSEEHLKFFQATYNDQKPLEMVRGQLLDLARTEIHQLKQYLAEKDKQISDLKHALSQKLVLDNTASKDKEIEELTSEVTRIKILSTTHGRKMQEMVEKAERAERNRVQAENKLESLKEHYAGQLMQLEAKYRDTKNSLEEKTELVAQLKRALQEQQGSTHAVSQQKTRDAEELKLAHLKITQLENELYDLMAGRPVVADYDAYIASLKEEYEKQIKEAKVKVANYENIYNKTSEKVQILEQEVEMLRSHIEQTGEEGDYNEDKVTIELLKEEMERLQDIIVELTNQIKEHQSKTQDGNSQDFEMEREELYREFQVEREEMHDKLRQIETSLLSSNQNARNLQIDLNQVREKLTKTLQELENVKYLKGELESTLQSYKNNASEQQNQKFNELRYQLKQFRENAEIEKQQLRDEIYEKQEIIEQLSNQLQELDEVQNLTSKINDSQVKDSKSSLVNISLQTSIDMQKQIQEAEQKLVIQMQQEYNEKQEDLREQLRIEFSTSLESHLYDQRLKLEREFNQQIENLKNSHKYELDQLESEYEANIDNIENEFKEKIRDIENESAQKLTQLRLQLDAERKLVQSLQNQIEEEMENQHDKSEQERNIKLMQRDIQLKTDELKSQYETDLGEKLKEFEEMFRMKKKEIQEKAANEIKQLQDEYDEISNELQQIKSQYEIQANEHQKQLAAQMNSYEIQLQEKQEKIDSLREKIQNTVSSQEEQLKQQFATEIETLKVKHQEQIQQIQHDHEEMLASEKKKYNEIISLKEEISQADTNRTKEELLEMLREKEEEWEVSARNNEQLLKSQYQREVQQKQTEIDELKQKLENQMTAIKQETTQQLKSEHQQALSKLKTEHSEALKKLKEKHQQRKREWEREARKLKETSEHALYKARKEVELQEMEKSNNERKEFDRKMQQKIKLLTHKHNKELSDKIDLIRLQFEQEKMEALKQQSETLKKNFAMKEQSLADHYNELQDAAIQEKALEVERKIRRELKDVYQKRIKDLEMEFTQERESLKNQYEMQLNKQSSRRKISDSFDSSLDMPFSTKQSRNKPISFTIKKRGLYAEKSLNISDYEQQPDMAQYLLTISNRNSMFVEDIRSAQLEIMQKQMHQKEVEKQRVQRFIENRLASAKKEECDKLYQFLASELDGARKVGSSVKLPIRGKSQYPRITELISNFIEQLQSHWVKEFHHKLNESEQKQDKIIQKYRSKLMNIENSQQKIKRDPMVSADRTADITMLDSIFLRYDGKLYQEVEAVIEDLILIQEAFDSMAEVAQPSFMNQTRDSPYNNLKEDYRKIINNLHRIALKVGKNKQGNRRNRGNSTDSSEGHLRVENDELQNKLGYCENELRKMVHEYKSYMIKTKSALERLHNQKKELESEKAVLNSKLMVFEEKLAEYEESPMISPEMLSPEETANLIMSIFKRSSKDALIQLMIQRNPSFLHQLNEFVEQGFENFEQHNIVRTPSRSQEIARGKSAFAIPLKLDEPLLSARTNNSYSRPRSAADVGLPPQPQNRSLQQRRHRTSMNRTSPRQQELKYILEQDQYQTDAFNVLRTY